MSSPASERPPRDTTTSRPYSTMKSDAPRRTGPRVKIPDEPVITETNSVLPETNSVLPETNSVLPETSDVSPRASVPPESLRKPYASLVPQKRTDVEKVTNSARPGVASDTESPNPAPVWDDSSSVTSGTGITSTATKTQKNANQCRKHGIQKNAAGVCMMCRKEQNESDEGTTWKMIIAVLVVAILGSGIAAVMI